MVHLGEQVIVLDCPAERVAEAKTVLAGLTGDEGALAVGMPDGGIRAVYRFPRTPTGMRRVEKRAQPFPGEVRITDRVVLDGPVLASHLASEPYTLIPIGPRISLRDGDPVSAIPEAPPALFAHLGFAFEPIPAPPPPPPPPPPVEMATVALDLDDHALVNRALALALPLEIVSFGDGSARTRYSHNDQYEGHSRLYAFDLALLGRTFRSRREASCDPDVVLGQLPKHQTGRGHLITAALGARGARLVTLDTPPGLYPDTAAADIAAALRMPLESVVVERRGGELEAIGFVVDDASLRALFPEGGPAFPYAWQIDDARIILPGLPHADGDDRSWDAPAGLDAFLCALAAPLAKASPELARCVANDDRLPQLLRARAAPKTVGPLPIDYADDDGNITLATRRSPLPRMILEGFIPRVGLVVFAGPSHAGKTWAIASLHAYIARGEAVAGATTAKALTIHLTADDPHDSFLARIQGFQQAHGLDGMPYVARSVRDKPLPGQVGRFDPRNPAQRAALIAYVRHHQAQHQPSATLISIETLRKIMGGGSPKNDQDVDQLYAALEEIAQACDAVVLVSHHPPKSETSAFAGDGSIYNGSDAFIEVQPFGARGIRLTADKLRAGPNGAILEGQRVDFTYTDSDGTEVQSALIEWRRYIPAGSPRGAQRTAGDRQAGEDQDGDTPPNPARTRETALLRAVRECLDREPVEHDDGTGHRVMAAGADAVREAFRVLVYGEADTRPDTVRRAFQRSLGALSGSAGPLRTSAGRKLLWLAEPEPAGQEED
ncbi:hypothetical protein J2X36_005267 [Methylobacterium sp. BE186]|nr:hypothetical protein [Methylobacterium sp. BE186]